MSRFPALTVTLMATLIAGSAQAASQPETIDLRVDHAPLVTLIERIARQCDAGLAIDSSLQEQMSREVTLNARDAPWKEAVALLESEYRISLTLVADRLNVVNADAEFRNRLVSRTYDVRVLTLPIDDFPGPKLDIAEPGSAGCYLMPPHQATPSSASAEISATIRRQIRPSWWTRDGMEISELNGALIITALPDIHAEILAFLQRLERAAAREVVCRVYRLPDNIAPLPAVLDAKAWRALAPTSGAPIATFAMLDSQTNHHFSGTQAIYVSDADVVQGIYDPIMSLVSHGLAVDVEPVVTIDGVVVTTRFSATINHDVTSAPVIDSAGKAVIDVQLPRTELDASNDSRLVPLGGAAGLRFAERTYALTFEVVTFTEPKPAK